MDSKEAARQKTFNAEKKISIVRIIVIVFGTITFFFLDHKNIQENLAYPLLVLIWAYGLYIPLFKPYEKYPVFTASWFTYISDSVFATLWLIATGGFYSPYHVMFYTSIIAVSFRFNFSTTLFTSALYTVCYFGLLMYMGQLQDHEITAVVRMGFVFIIGFATNLITSETLFQTQQKVGMEKLMKEAQEHHEKLKQSQQKLKALNEKLQLKNDIFNHAEENAAIGSYSWDLATNNLEYSDNLFRILGCEPGAFKPTFETYLEFVHEEDRPAMISSWEESLQTKIIRPKYQRIILKDGTLKYLKTTGRMAGEGSNIVVIGTIQDVTPDMELNKVLQQKNIELERSNNELASFNYIASHDLQEPVRKINTFAKLIEDKEPALSEASAGYLTRIISSAVRMKHLIDAFLNYSKTDSSPLLYEFTDLNLVVDEAIDSLKERIEETNTTVEKLELPVLKGAKIQLQQLFINLISNAIKYRKNEVSPLIRIHAVKLHASQLPPHPAGAGASEYWKISVEDNGIGFDQKYSEKIFEVFQRLHNREQYEGTGIGLSICKKIAQSHEGFIIASSEGNGATFSIYLPA
ncbi:MAG: PAS domain-containing protein [Bacteroidetes bacterium]|nr:PAS domain-containing protein [Bacteroidota bacterium]